MTYERIQICTQLLHIVTVLVATSQRPQCCCPLANKAENIDLKLVWAVGMQTYTHLMGNLGPQLKHGSFTAPRNASQMATSSAMSSTCRLSDTHTHRPWNIDDNSPHLTVCHTQQCSLITINTEIRQTIVADGIDVRWMSRMLQQLTKTTRRTQQNGYMDTRLSA